MLIPFRKVLVKMQTSLIVGGHWSLVIGHWSLVSDEVRVLGQRSGVAMDRIYVK
jgi:hypothetical protein